MYLEKLLLDGRLAVVTGGARGIGRAITEALTEAGATVVICDREAQTAAATAAELTAAGRRVASLALDVCDAAAVADAARRIAAELGGIDILVNNAGIARNSPAESTSDAEWLEILDVNLNGVYWCCGPSGR